MVRVRSRDSTLAKISKLKQDRHVMAAIIAGLPAGSPQQGYRKKQLAALLTELQYEVRYASGKGWL